MKKLTALFLLLCIIFSLTACGTYNNGKDTDTPEAPEENQPTPPAELTVIVPDFKDYGRGTVDFTDLVYARPNLEGVINSFDSTAETIKANTKSVDDYIVDIRALEEPLSTVKTMYSLAEIYQSKNSSDEFWQAEYEYLSTNYPKLSQSIEALLIACAKSEHREAFEEKYFEYSLEEYLDGETYTDEVVALMEGEAALEAEFSSLGTANVEITYESVSDSSIKWTGTTDEVIKKANEHYSDNPDMLDRVLFAIDLLYEEARGEREEQLLVELIKVRRLIADSLGYQSYSEYAYDVMEYDYSVKDMMGLIEDIGRYVAPVASELESGVFLNYFMSNPQPTSNHVTVINDLYEVYTRLGGDYKDAYCYMLQHGLYDVAKSDANRQGGAFTTYLESNSSPFVFMTSSGFIRDYTTLSHEFGHFFDGYINYGEDDSLAIMEISSQALELLTLTKLKTVLHSAEYGYLEYYTLFSFLNSVLLTQSFYAAFEHLVYTVPYDDITVDRIEDVIEEAYSMVFGENNSFEGDLSYVTITHTALYPFYVESYVTSALVSLDIFFAENSKTGTVGEGFRLYEALVDRSGGEASFADRLEAAGLCSPFDSSAVKQTANNIYFLIIGKCYYKPSGNDVNVA